MQLNENVSGLMLVPFGNGILNLISSFNKPYSMSEIPYSIEIGKKNPKLP